MKRPHKILATCACVGATATLATFLALSVHSRARAAADDPSADAGSDSYRLVDPDTLEAPAAAVKAAGIRTMAVEPRDIPVTLAVTGRTGLNMETVAHVHAQFGGKVTRVAPELGSQVKGPDAPGGPTVLCVIESTDLANAKANYLQAKVQLKLDQENLVRTKELVKSTVLADKFLLDAESAVTKDAAVLEAGRQQLLVFGLTQKDIDQVDTQQGRQRMDYVINSPRSGVVAEKGVSGGEIADPTLNLFTIADTSTMWVWGDVYERDLKLIKVGDPVKAIFTSDPDHPLASKVDWISPVLDPNTHSIRIRCKVDNKQGRLLADMYGTLLLTVDSGRNAVVVPAECVVREGTKAYAFAQVGPGGKTLQFKRVAVEVAPVDVGFGTSDSATAATSSTIVSRAGTGGGEARPVRIVSGIQPGETIVRSGALGLFNELQQHTKQ
jgi:cobalt-zinc-cadmium efflux system membrane fusion protein